MFYGTTNGASDANGITGVNETTDAAATAPRHRWQDIDRNLRALAKRRGGIDAYEARLLCSAVRLEVWRELGKASLLEYLEEVLGYGPRAATERVRVALALDELPDLARALADGELSYSAVRELTRVATPATEAAWCDHARGLNLRQIEDKVAFHKRGDRPSDPPSPEPRARVLRFEVRPATFALVRQVQQVLADEPGGMLDDDALVAAMCNAVLGGGASDGEPERERAKFQVVTQVCPSCEWAAQEGAGAQVPVSRADRERAECDAERLSPTARTTQDVTPKKRREVFRRDRGKCCVPGCRASRHLEIHHIIPRASGGGHDLENLTLLCDGHHHALHDGKLTITGKAPAITVRWAHHPMRANAPVGKQTRTHVGMDLAPHAADAVQALVALKFPRPVAANAVATALERLGGAPTLERLVYEALRGVDRVTAG